MPSFPVSRSNSQPLLPLWENSTQQANLHLLLLKKYHTCNSSSHYKQNFPIDFL